MDAQTFSKKKPCLNCKVDRVLILHVQLTSSGSETFIWICSVCNKRNPSGDKNFFIARELIEQHLTPEQIENLPVLMPTAYCRCTRCGERNAELHHWAPKGIFGQDEAEKWPKDYLCKTCHDLWHVKVTPQLVTND